MAKNKIPNTVGGTDPFADLINNNPNVPKTLEQIRAEKRLGIATDYINEQYAKVGRGEMPLASANELASRVSPTVNSLQRTINGMEEVNELKAGREYGRRLGSALNESSSSSRVNGYSADPNIVGAGMRMSSMTYDDVYGQKNEFKQRADQLRGKMMDEASSASPNRAELSRLGSSLNYAERGMAASSVAMRAQARAGLDPTGQFKSIDETMNSISGRERSAATNQAVQSGGIDWKAFQQALTTTADSLKQLNKEFIEGTKTEKEYREEAAKLAAQYNQGLDTEKAGMKAGQNVSGQSFLEKIKNSMTGTAELGAWGSGISAAGRLVSYAGVQSSEQRMDLDIGFAGMANRKFDDSRAGLGGNMAAFRRAFGGAYDTANKVGNQRALFAGAGQALQATGQGIQDVANASSAATSGDAQGAINTAIGGVESGVMTTIDAAKGITVGQASLRGQQQSLASQDANKHVSDVGKQRVFDTMTGINRATFGAGSKRAGLVGSIGSSKMISDMATDMISQEQMAALTAQGVQQLGGAMSASVLSGAGRAQKSGLMSAGDYIGNIATMTNTGGGARELENVMKSAVAAGMDNSKNIAQMVAATADLAGKTAASGINSSSGAASIIAKGVQGLSSLPENMRAGAAATAANYAFEVSKGKGLDLASVAQWSGVSKAFPNASIGERTGLSRLSPQEIATIKAGGKDAMSVIEGKGLQSVLTKNGQIDKSAVDAVESENRSRIINKVTSFGMAAPNDSVRKELTEFGRTGKGLKKGDEAFRYLMQEADVNDISGLGLAAELGAGGPKQRAARGGTTGVDAAESAGMKAEAKLFADGLKNFGGSFNDFAKRMNELADSWPIDDTAAETMSHSFDTLEKGAKLFDNTVEGLKKWLDSKMHTGGGGAGGGGASKAGTGKAHWWSHN